LTLGVIAGGTTAGYLGDHFGWRSAFLLLGTVGILLVGILAVWLRDPDSPSVPGVVAKESFRTTLRGLSNLPTYGIILAEAGLIASSNWIFANWLPLFFREAYGLTLAAAGFSGTFAFTAGAATAVFTGGYLSDRLAHANPRRRLLMQGVAYVLAAPLLLVFLGRPAVGVLGFAIFMHGFLRNLGSVNELPLLCDLLPTHRRGAAFGIMNALNTFIGGSGVLISGMLMSHADLGDIFVALTGVVLLASVVSLIGYRWVLPKDLERQTREMARS
jgi:predicted MFS family arabinose efflux permease